MVELLAFGPWAMAAISLPLAYLAVMRYPKFSGGASLALASAWIVIVQGDSILLGPLARPEWGDGEQLFTGYLPMLARSNGLFLHNLAGGVDALAIGRFGGEFISARRELAGAFPLWVPIVALRIFVTGIALLGVWLFATRALNCPRPTALALAALHAVGWDFTATLTFLYGLSLAAFPFLLWLLFTSRGASRDWAAWTLASFVYVSLADPIYWLPSLWLSAASIWIWRRPESPRFLLLGLIALSIAWIANYAETIYGFMMLLPHAGRSLSASTAPLTDAIARHAYWLLAPRWDYNAGSLALLVPLAIAVVSTIATRNRDAGIGALLALAVGMAAPFLSAVPWTSLGLPQLSQYRWYVEYASFGLALLAAAAGTVTFGKRGQAFAAAIVFAVASGKLVSMRAGIWDSQYVRGNLSYLDGIPNLKTLEWLSQSDTRVISVPGRLDPNAAASYGLATLDGGATLFAASLIRYWRHGIIRSSHGAMREAPGLYLATTDSACSPDLATGAMLDWDLLRVANVGWILSYCPLQAPGVTQVSGPMNPTTPRLRDMLFERPPPVGVYRIDGTLPRVYAATSIMIVDDAATATHLLRQVSAHGLQRIAVMRSSDAAGLSDWTSGASQQQSSVELSIVADGYDVDLAPSGALLVVNTPWLPFWVARDEGGRRLMLAPTNEAQFAVAVPPGVTRVAIRYERETLARKLHKVLSR